MFVAGAGEERLHSHSEETAREIDREVNRIIDESLEKVREILKTQDASGIWLEAGTVRDAKGKKVQPKGGVVSSGTFAKNVGVLSAWLMGGQ